MQRPANLKAKLISKGFISKTILEVKYQLFDSFTFTPGQFVNISVTEPFRRPYSVLDFDQDKNKIDFMIEIKEPGKGADYFRNAEIGSETIIMGPLGRFVVQNSNLPKAFISTGAGVAPFVPMLKQLKQNNFSQNITVFQGMRHSEDDCALPYFKEYVESGFIKYIQCITREETVLKLPEEEIQQKLTSGNTATTKGRVTEIVPEFGFDYLNTEFYVCGGNQMVKDMRLNLSLLGADKVYIENYG